MTTVQLSKRLINVEEYHLMAEVGILKPEDRVELIKGEIFHKSPIGSKHASCVNLLAKMLIIRLGDEAVVRVQNPLTIESLSEPEPDIAVVRIPFETYEDRHPTPADVHLLIEVADSTLEKDRNVKLPVYAEEQVPEVWIINLNDAEIEAYQFPQGQKYKQMTIFQAGESLQIPGFDLEISVDEVLKLN